MSFRTVPQTSRSSGYLQMRCTGFMRNAGSSLVEITATNPCHGRKNGVSQGSISDSHDDKSADAMVSNFPLTERVDSSFRTRSAALE